MSDRAAQLRQRLEPVFAQLVLDEAGFTLGGARIDWTAGGDPATRLAQLQTALYAHAYALASPRSRPVAEAAVHDLANELVAANLGCARWDDGWRVWASLTGGRVLAVKGASVRSVSPGGFVLHDGGAPARGAAVSLYAPAHSLRTQPGYFVMHGESVGDEEDGQDLVRIYWNIAPEAAAALVHGLSSALNRLQAPFSFKCPVLQSAYDRCDTAVLYLNKRHFHVTRFLIEPIVRDLSTFLRPPTPLFSQRLAPGVAVAEDPGGGVSFGMQRSGLLATAVTRARLGATPAERFAELEGLFAELRLDLERPYLNPGSSDIYESTQGFA